MMDHRWLAPTLAALAALALAASTAIPGATFVPSQMTEIGHLQAEEGYVYPKP